MEFQEVLKTKIADITFDDWASASTLMNKGISQEEVLHVLEIELPLWHQAMEQWNLLLEKHQELTKYFSEIYMHPFIGEFKHLKPENKELIHPKVKDLDTYYKVLCHTEEIKNYGIDFLTILEKHHQLSWEEWSNIQTKFLANELDILKNGSIEAKKQLHENTQSSISKWEQYWKEYYKDKNLNLTADINF